MHLKLKVLRGASAGKEVVVAGPRFFIGRAEECHLRANSDAISRRHCAITVTNEGVRVRDLGSRNGTFVNGVKIEGDQPIQMGDQLRVGPLEFLVSYMKAPAPVKAAPRPAAGEDEMAGLIDDWLSADDDRMGHTQVMDPETREFRMDETDRINLKAKPDGPGAVEAEQPVAPEPAAAAQDADGGESDAAKSEPVLAPQNRRATPKNAPPKDTQEAAAQTLRKFFNRGS